MNIFALHNNPRKASRWHVDKHVVKMILETAQLLYTAHWVLFYPELKKHKSAIGLSRAQKKLDIPEYMKTAPLCETSGEATYRPCHVNHPCAKWTRHGLGNYKWLAELGKELVREFRFRFKKEHSCEKHIKWLYEHYPPTIKDIPRKTFAIAMDNEYKISTNSIVCYRHYYNTQKREKGIIKYTGRHTPHWIIMS